MNDVKISGRLTRDVTLKNTASGIPYAFFSIANNELYREKGSGEWKEHTTFVPIIAWGMRAERCAKRLSKGQFVIVEGKYDSFKTEKNGQKITLTRVRLLRFDGPFQLVKAESADGGTPKFADEEPDWTPYVPAADSTYSSDDDIPF